MKRNTRQMLHIPTEKTKKTQKKHNNFLFEFNISQNVRYENSEIQKCIIRVQVPTFFVTAIILLILLFHYIM